MMYELDNVMVFGTSGSGNQKKAWFGDTLVKVDSKYRESIKERDASIIGTAFGLNMVKYQVDKCIFDGKMRNCSVCKTYLGVDESTLTLNDILNMYNIVIPMNMSAVDYFSIVCKCIYNCTGLDARQYLMSLLVFDFLIANPDRHLSNIEFIRGRDYFRFTPIFDNGQAFFKSDADLTYNQLEQKYRSFKPLPFSRNPKKNLIDLNIARAIADRYRSNCNSFASIRVSDSRKKLLRFMYNKLQG